MNSTQKTQLETSRLWLFPLTYPQLVNYLRMDYSLEKELAVHPHPRNIPPELRDALEQSLLPSVADPANNYLFYTLWTIVLKELRVMAGDLCFKGEPNERGEVEIGYGTYPDFQNRGIMSEAIAALTEWAFGQEKVRTILAETEKSNAASARTLEKNNFRPFYEIADRIWWRKDKQPSALSSQL